MSTSTTRIAIGTEKGAYLAERGSNGWSVTGPIFPGWKVTAFGKVDDTHLAAVASNWFGVGVHRSPDFTNWEPVDHPPSWGEDGDRKMEQIWRFHNDGDRLWAGVAHAGLFTSLDGGVTWDPVEGLNEHPTRSEWQPGAGGLTAHRILTGGGRIWAAISAVGVFRSDDGGANWILKNEGVPAAGQPEDAPRPEVGYCVHGLAQDPDAPDHLWRQDHMGVFRSRDGGDSWDLIENGLPAGFGFVMWRDSQSGRLFTIPLESPANRVPVEGRLRVFVSDDGGDNWAIAGTGWPSAPQFTGVLRGAFDGDGEGTFAFGTTGGDVWLTSDNGGTWTSLEASFPRIGAISLL